MTVGFSQVPAAGAVTTTTFTLLDDLAVPVAGSVTTFGNHAVFTPATALSPSTAYEARIASSITGVAGETLAAPVTWTFTTTQLAPPPAPGGVTATAGDSAVTIGWADASTATSYNVYWSTDAAVSPVTGTKVAAVTSPWVHTGRANGTHYYYVVTAENAGGEGPASATVGATPGPTAPPAPSGISATASDRQVSIAWSPVAGATSYNVYWSTTAGVTPATGALIADVANPFLHGGLANGSTYYYVVTAVNAVGESAPSVQISAMPVPPPPAAPVITTQAGDNKVTVSWPAAAGADSYDLYVSAVAGARTNGSVTGDVTSPVEVPGVNGQTYYFVVVARNLGGETLSNEVWSVPTQAPPPAPASLAATGYDGEVVLAWPASAGATSYDLYWSTTAGVSPATGTKVAGISSPHTFAGANGTTYHFVVVATNLAGDGPPSPEASAAPHEARPSAPSSLTATGVDGAIDLSWPAVVGATSYDLYWSATPGVTPATGTRIASVARPYSFAAANGSTRHFVVTASNAGGESGPSPQASATAQAAVPRPPSGVAAQRADGAAVVSWIPSAGATSYDVYWSTSASVTPATGTKVPGVASPATVGGLSNGTNHYFVVTASSGGGESLPSATVSATPSVDPPDAPGGVVATAGDGSVTISWGAVAGATSYDLYWSAAPTVSSAAGFKVAGVTSPWVHAGLTNGSTYRYVVVANGPGGASVDSVPVLATPREATPPTVSPSAPVAGATFVLPTATVTATFSESVVAADVESAFTLADGAMPVVGTVRLDGQLATFTPSALLSAGVTYTATVAAGVHDLAGNPLATTATWTFTVAPPGPTGLTAVEGNGAVTLAWEATTGAYKYEVYRWSDADPVVRWIGTAWYPYFTDRGLANGVPYTYYVSATTTDESDLSAPLVAMPSTGKPETPGSVVAVASDGQIVLTWTGTAAGYQVLAASSKAGPFTVVSPVLSGTGYVDYGLANGVPRFYVVQALSFSTPGAWSQLVTATPTASALTAPTGLAATPGNGWARIGWNGVAGATAYLVLHASNPEGPYAVVGTTTATTIDDVGLANGLPTYWVVVATGPGGTSGPRSSPVSAVPSATGVPQTPTIYARGSRASAWVVAGVGAATNDVQFFRSTSPGGPYTEVSYAYANPLAPWWEVYDGGLFVGTTYYYVARARNGTAVSALSSEVAITAIGAVQTPGNVRTQVGDGQMTVRCDPSAGAVSYTVIARYTDGTTFQTVTDVNPSVSFSAPNGVPLDISVFATGSYLTGYGETSAESGAVRATATQAGLAMPSFSAVPGNGQVLLRWPSVNGATGYAVYRVPMLSRDYNPAPAAEDWLLLATLPGTATQYRDSAVVNGQRYRYALAALSGATEGPWNWWQWATPGTAHMPTPGGVRLQPGNGYVTVRFDPVPGATSYAVDIYRQGEPSHYSYIATDSTAATFQVTNGQPLEFDVSAVGPAGEGPHGDKVAGTASAIGLPPPSMEVTTGWELVAGNDQVLVQWAPVAGATEYAVYRWSFGPDWVKVATVAASVTRYRDFAVVNGTNYRYAVAAVNGGTEGPWNQFTQLPTPPSDKSPLVPGNVRTLPGNGFVTVRFDPVPGATGYFVDVYAPDGSFLGANFADVPSTTFSVTNGQALTFDVAATFAATWPSGETPHSAPVAATGSVSGLPRPAVTATPGNGQVQLQWAPLTGPTGYHVYRWETGPDWTLVATLPAGAFRYRDIAAENGRAYRYAVVPLSGGNEGPWFETGAIAPSASLPLVPRNVRVLEGNGFVTVRFEPDSVPGVPGYRVAWFLPDGTNVGSTVTGSLTLTLSATNGQTLLYDVSTILPGWAGETPRSDLATATAAAGLLARPNGGATGLDGQVLVQWGPVAGATGYQVYRSSPGVDWQITAVLPAGASSFTDSGVANGTGYTYAVAALSGAEEGPWSDFWGATPSADRLRVPTNVRVLSGDGAVTVRFDPVPGAVLYSVDFLGPTGTVLWSTNVDLSAATLNVSGELGYSVSAVSASGFETPHSAPVTGAPVAGGLRVPTLAAYPGNGEVLLEWGAVPGASDYLVYRGTPGGDWQLLSVLPGAATRHRDVGLANGATYRYAVAAAAGAVEGPWGTTSATPDATLPATPAEVAVIPGNGAITVVTGPIPGAVAYQFEVFTLDGSSIASGSTALGDFTFAATNGVPYLVDVRASDGARSSPRSERLPAVASAALPDRPTITVTPGAGSLTVAWSPVAGAASYRVYRHGAAGWMLVRETPLAQFVDTSVTSGSVATYAVSAVSGAGEGAWSAAAAGTAN